MTTLAQQLAYVEPVKRDQGRGDLSETERTEQRRPCNESTKGTRDQGLLLLLLVAGVCFIHGGSATAQVRTYMPFVVAPEPVGSGARALGQSAFIAVADDATAASWNPAGLVSLERPEVSVVGVWKTLANDFSSQDNRISLDGGTRAEWEGNFLSYAQPMRVGNADLVFSVNYHQVYDLGQEYGMATRSVRYKVTTQGAIAAYSLAGGLSMPFYPKVSVGASFNWYAQTLSSDYIRRVQTHLVVLPLGSLSSLEARETLDDFRGSNFTFGLLWDAYERGENLLTLGLVCHTPFTGKVHQEVAAISPGDEGLLFEATELDDIDFPLALGAGANYRFSDRLSAAFDVQWTDWSDLNLEYAGGTSPPSDAVAYRFGFEYLLPPRHAGGSIWALRSGVFYEPRPAWTGTMPTYGFSLGFGWTVKNRFSLDFAYQYRRGEADDFTVGSTRFDYGVEEHWLVSSLIVSL